MLTEIGQKAKETSYVLGKMGTNLKNAGLLAAAQEILDEENEILKANAADVARSEGERNGSGTCGPPGTEP